MIELKKLSAGYGGKTVVKDVSLCFPAGQVTVLLGPNGSGKSTLLKASLGLIAAGREQVFYDGVPIEKLSRRQVARTAALLSQNRPDAEIEAKRLVLHGRFPYLSYPRQYTEKDRQIAKQAMERTGASVYAGQLVSRLSGGQKQSVYLAMLLAQQTQTVFLDEPTAFLDIRHQLELMGWVKQLAGEGRAAVMVLHDLPLAMEYADRIALMEAGRLVFLGTPEALYESGKLESVFGIRFTRLAGEDGVHYVCSPKEETQ